MKDEPAVQNKHKFLVREMKEQMCHVAYDYEDEIKSRDDCLNQE